MTKYISYIYVIYILAFEIIISRARIIGEIYAVLQVWSNKVFSFLSISPTLVQSNLTMKALLTFLFLVAIAPFIRKNYFKLPNRKTFSNVIILFSINCFILTSLVGISRLFLPSTEKFPFTNLGIRTPYIDNESYTIMIIAACMIAPLLEELVFRKILLVESNKIMKMKYAVVLSAFVFSFVHLNESNFSVENIVYFGNRAIAYSVMTIIYLNRGFNLIDMMIAHSLWNFFNGIYYSLPVSYPIFIPHEVAIYAYQAGYFIGFALTIYYIYTSIKGYIKTTQSTDLERPISC